MNGLVDYTLSIIGNYYTESVLAPGLYQRTISDDIACLSVQCFWYFLCSLYPLVNRLRRTKITTQQPVKKSVPKVHKNTNAIKRIRYTAGSGDRKSRAPLKEEVTERIEKTKILVIITFLACINIMNKVIMYKSLEYTTYPTMAIVRSFRIFPLSLGRRESKGIFPGGMISVVVALVGIFTYVFSREERTENLFFLQRLAQDHKNIECLQPETKRKLIRMALRFLDLSIRKSKHSFHGITEEEENFVSGILQGTPQIHPYLYPLDQQGRFFKGLIRAYHNQSVDSKSVSELFHHIDHLDTPEAQVPISHLIYSFCSLVSIDKNSLYFKVFLERNKINAAVLLTIHSWLEILLESGQVVLFKMYSIDYQYILYGTNLLSSVICWSILLLTGYPKRNMYRYIRRDVFMATFTLSLTRVFSFSEKNKGSIHQMSMQIGRKFFSLLMSLVFFGHDFNLGHCIGILLMFLGCLMNLNMHSVLLSRWTFQGHLKRRCI
ncbi:hypothetical protein NEOKW01_1565 [Nematocida sp. AWRm80]|nr:hypothetical protein NEOKW01_1565 [Nematocida sp. AWRm80]